MIWITAALAHPIDTAITEMIAPAVEEDVLQGVVVKVITPHDVRTIQIGAFSKNPQRSAFEIGTVTAPFTGYLLADAVQRGEVGLDDLLSSHVEFPVPAGITLRQLATHTSGLPSLPPDFQPANPSDPFANFDQAALAAAAAKVVLRDPPGDVYSPSYLGFALLGHALAHASHTAWPQLLTTRIKQPLKLRSVGADTPAPVVGHNADGEVVSEWTLNAFGPAGGVHASPTDLTRFIQRYLSSPDPITALSSRPQHTLGDAGGVALGWHITPDGTLWQNGQTSGFHCLIAFQPTRKQGVVVLSNTASALVDSIGFNTLALLNGAPYPSLSYRHAVQINSVDLQALAGVYGDATVSIHEGTLILSRRGQTLRLTPESATVFFHRTENTVAEFDGDTLILEAHGKRPEELKRTLP